MRTVMLALALLVSSTGALANDEAKPTDDAIQALVDKGEDERGFALAQRGAEAGDPRAIEWVAWFYDEGRGVERDVTLAAKNYRIAAAAGQNYARWRLGVMIDTGEAEGTLEEAVELFKAAADEDFTNAITSLAVMQATGRGTELDYEASLENYMRAARLGNPHGIQGVGVLFARGEGVPRDLDEAMAWFLVAAAVGNEAGNANFNAMTQGMSDAEIQPIVERAYEIGEEFGIDLNIVFADEATPADDPKS